MLTLTKSSHNEQVNASHWWNELQTLVGYIYIAKPCHQNYLNHLSQELNNQCDLLGLHYNGYDNTNTPPAAAVSEVLILKNVISLLEIKLNIIN